MKTLLVICLSFLLLASFASAQGKHPYASDQAITQPKPFPIPGVKSAWHLAFTPDGNTFYFVTSGDNDMELVKFSTFRDGKWSAPELAAFSGKYRIETPSISPDGSKFFFTFATSGSENIYVMNKTASGWSEPRDLGNRVNSPAFDGCPSSATNGNLYFFSNREGGRFSIYRAKWQGTDYGPAEKLTPVFDAFNTGELCVAPDESFLLFNVQRPDNTYHLYVSRREGDTWTTPRDLGPQVNFSSYQGRPCLSPDGKYLFYTAGNTKDWVMSQYQVERAAIGL